MLVIWGRRTSSNVQALMWLVGELGLPYERHDVGHRYGGNDTPSFLAMNPNGLVPVIRDGDEPPLWETGAILRHLASRYAEPSFWPKHEYARAIVDQWAEWSKNHIAMEFTGPIFWRVVRTAPSKRDSNAISTAIARFDRSLDIAEAQLAQRRFLVSDDFTLADIQFGHVLFRYYDINIVRKERPALDRYFEDLQERPAFREHVVVSYEELRALD